MGSDLSYMWKSLLWGREFLLKGLRYRIGDSSSIKTASDPWLPRPNTFKRIVVNPRFKDSLVVDFLLPSGQWNVSLLQEAFSMEDYEMTKGIPTCSKLKDSLLWHFDKKGLHIIKSGYKF